MHARRYEQFAEIYIKTNGTVQCLRKVEGEIVEERRVINLSPKMAVIYEQSKSRN